MMTFRSIHFPKYLPPVSVGLLWIAGVGLADWLTGREVSLSAFYLPGIALVAWYSERGRAIVMACCAAMAWLAAELAHHPTYSSPIIPYWNASIRFLFFLITALLTSEVRARQRTEQALREHDNILTSILDSMGDGVVVVGVDGNILVFNPAAERLLGTAPTTDDAKAWAVGMDAKHAGEVTRKGDVAGPFSLAISGLRPSPDELSIHSGDEKEGRILGISAHPLLASGNKSSGVVLILTDLTAKRTLEKRIAEASEREQRRIGRDLHDGVCQHLVGVAFAAGTLQNRLESIPMPEEAIAAGEVASLINDAITEARSLAHGLFPAGLDEGISIALIRLANATTERTGIPIELFVEDPPPCLTPADSTHLHRIAQEAIHNACRHAQPEFIRVSLSAHGDKVKLIVEDNGKGFDPQVGTATGIGLSLMRHRAALMGGSLVIESIPGQGSRVSCLLSGNQTQQPVP